MSQHPPAYGLWSLVVINIGIFAMFEMRVSCRDL